MTINSFEVAKTKNGFVGKKTYYRGSSGTLFNKSRYVLIFGGAEVFIAEMVSKKIVDTLKGWKMEISSEILELFEKEVSFFKSKGLEIDSIIWDLGKEKAYLSLIVQIPKKQAQDTKKDIEFLEILKEFADKNKKFINHFAVTSGTGKTSVVISSCKK